MAARSATGRSAASRARSKQAKKAAGGSAGKKKDGTRVGVMKRGEDGFGMAIASDCTVSSFVFPGCPAELAGLTVGSRILEVNGQSVETKKALLNEIKYGGASVEVKYRLPDEIAAAKVRCNQGHALKREARIDHLCNLCAVQGTHFGCPENCDYDVCTGCYEKILQKAQEDASRSWRLQQMESRSPRKLGGQADHVSYDKPASRHDAHGVVDALPQTTVTETTSEMPASDALDALEGGDSGDEGPDLVDLYSALLQLEVGQLRQRAQDDGVSTSQIERACEGRDAKEDLTALILGHASRSPAPEDSAAPESVQSGRTQTPKHDRLPAGWESTVSRSTGETYYVNTVTGETTYDWPQSPAEDELVAAEDKYLDAEARTPEPAKLPAGWESTVSRSTGETYYVNTVTGETTYDWPQSPAEDELAVGASAASSGPAAEVDPEPPPVHSDEHALPDGWATATSREGETYFVNKLTGESTFDVPTAPAIDNRPLPQGWTSNVSESSGQMCYVHVETGFASYQRPSDDPADWVLETSQQTPFERYDVDRNGKIDMEELRNLFVELGYEVDDEYLFGALEHFGDQDPDHEQVLVILPGRFPELWTHIDGDNLLADFLARGAANDTPIKKIAANLAKTLNPITAKADQFVQQKFDKLARMGQLPAEQNNEIMKHTLLKPKRWFSVKRGLGKKEEAEIKELMLAKQKLAMQEEIADQLNATLPPGWRVMFPPEIQARGVSFASFQYYNESTGETTYSHPGEQADGDSQAMDRQDRATQILPAGWESAVSRTTGETYYVNVESGETTYEWPESNQSPAPAMPPDSPDHRHVRKEYQLPRGWESRVSRSTGETYYVNSTTGETTYDFPTEAVDTAPHAGAEAPAVEALPDGWSTGVSRSTGEIYYVNLHSGETTYDYPAESPASVHQELPDGWSAEVSRSTGETYYVNLHSGETTYDYPYEPVGPLAEPEPEPVPDAPTVAAKQSKSAPQEDASVDVSMSFEADANQLETTVASITAKKKKRQMALVIKNFPGGQQGDLPLEKGQRVVITKGPAEKKWWRGHLEGKKEAKGIFPRACIEVIEDEPAPEKTAVSVTTSSADVDSVRAAQAARKSKLEVVDTQALGEGPAEEARKAAEERVREAARIAAEEEARKTAAVDEAVRVAAEQKAAAAAAQAKAQARLRAQAQEAQARAKAEAQAKEEAEAEAFAAAEQQAKVEAEAKTAARAEAAARIAAAQQAHASAQAEAENDKARRQKRARPRRDSIDSTGGSSVASSVASISSRRKQARVLYDFEGEAEGDLSLRVGQIVLLTKSNPGKNWWRGYRSDDPTKARGAFPASFVQIVEGVQRTAVRAGGETDGSGADPYLVGTQGSGSSRLPVATSSAPGNAALRSALVSAGVSPNGVSTVASEVASLEELELLDYEALMTLGLRLADRSKITAMRESMKQPAAKGSSQAPAPKQAGPSRAESEAGLAGGTTEDVVAVIDGEGKLGISFDVVWDEDAQEESEDLMISGITPGSLASVQAPQLTEGLVLLSIQGESVSGTSADDVLDLLRRSGRPLRLGFAAAGYTSPR